MGLSLRLKNYRTFRRAAFAPAGVCALVGPNGVGKTTLLGAIDFARLTFERGLGAALDVIGARLLKHDAAEPHEAVELSLAVNGLRWELSVGASELKAMSPAERAFVDDRCVLVRAPGASTFELGGRTYELRPHETALRRAVEAAALPELEPFARALTGFVFHHNPHVYSLRTSGSLASSDTTLHPTGRNALAALRNWRAGLREHRERYEFVHDGLREAFPDLYLDMDFEAAGQAVTARFYRPGVQDPVPAFYAPNGLLLGLIHLAAVAAAPPGGVLGIDEFENGLHPFAIRRLIDRLRLRADELGLTVLLTTHSPVVLDAFDARPEAVYVLEHAEPCGGVLVPLVDHSDPNWLAHFSLGRLYADERFGRQKR